LAGRWKLRRWLGLRLLHALRCAAVWAVAVCHAAHLFRFGLANARVLRSYRRNCHRYHVSLARRAVRGWKLRAFPIWRTWCRRVGKTIVWLWAVRPLTSWLLVGGWLRLVVPVPNLSGLGDARERQRLRHIFHEVVQMRKRPHAGADQVKHDGHGARSTVRTADPTRVSTARLPRPNSRPAGIRPHADPPSDAVADRAIDPLTDPLARGLQETIVRRVFWKLFDVRLEVEESQVLGYYGTLDTALYEFLWHCGLPDEPPAYEPLQMFLPLFVGWARLRHQRLASRRHLLDRYRSWSISMGGLTSLWRRAQAVAFRIRAARFDTRLQASIEEWRRRGYDALRGSVMRRALPASLKASQSDAMATIAFEMYLRALSVLLQQSGSLSRLDADYPSERYQGLHRLAVRRAARQLRRRLSMVLDPSAKGDSL